MIFRGDVEVLVRPDNKWVPGVGQGTVTAEGLVVSFRNPTDNSELVEALPPHRLRRVGARVERFDWRAIE